MLKIIDQFKYFYASMKILFVYFFQEHDEFQDDV